MEVVLMFTKKKLGIIFGLVQYYGETIQYLRGLCDDEKSIIQDNEYSKIEIENLRFIKKQQDYAATALRAVALELDKKHGICMPGVTGWRNSDQDRFFPDSASSTSKQGGCCPKPKQ